MAETVLSSGLAWLQRSGRAIAGTATALAAMGGQVWVARGSRLYAWSLVEERPVADFPGAVTALIPGTSEIAVIAAGGTLFSCGIDGEVRRIGEGVRSAAWWGTTLVLLIGEDLHVVDPAGEVIPAVAPGKCVSIFSGAENESPILVCRDGKVHSLNGEYLGELPSGVHALHGVNAGNGGLFCVDQHHRAWSVAAGVTKRLGDRAGTGIPMAVAMGPLSSGVFASVGADRSLHLWDVKVGWLGYLPVRGALMGCLAFLDEDLVVGLASREILTITEVRKRVRRPRGHRGSVWSIDVCHERLLAGDADGALLWWSGNQPTELARQSSWITGVAIVRDTALFTTSGGVLGRIRLGQPRESASVEAHQGWANTLTVLSCGQVATGGSDGYVRLWECPSLRKATEVKVGSGWVNAAVALGPALYCGLSDGRVVRVRDGKVTTSVTVGSPVTALAAMPDGALMVATLDGRLLRIEGDIPSLVMTTRERVWGMDATKDGHCVLVGSNWVMSVVSVNGWLLNETPLEAPGTTCRVVREVCGWLEVAVGGTHGRLSRTWVFIGEDCQLWAVA